MRDGFIRVAAATPKVRVADPAYNREEIGRLLREAAGRQVKVLVFPELCLTAYTCGDLFLQDSLLREARRQLGLLVAESAGMDVLAFVGLPWEISSWIFN